MKPRSLSACKSGDRVIVTRVDGAPTGIDRLASIGLLPGIELQVRQTRPVVVIECDQTTFALDHEVASTLIVDDCDAGGTRAAE